MRREHPLNFGANDLPAENLITIPYHTNSAISLYQFNIPPKVCDLEEPALQATEKSSSVEHVRTERIRMACPRSADKVLAVIGDESGYPLETSRNRGGLLCLTSQI